MRVDVRVRGDTRRVPAPSSSMRRATRRTCSHSPPRAPELSRSRHDGEMSGNVASTAPCDVLMVPRAGRPWQGAVLAAVDGSSTASHVAATAARVARPPTSRFTSSVSHRTARDDVVGHARDVLRRAIEALAREGIPRTARLRGRPQGRNRRSATDCGADLIVVGRRGSPVHCAGLSRLNRAEGG